MGKAVKKLEGLKVGKLNVGKVVKPGLGKDYKKIYAKTAKNLSEETTKKGTQKQNSKVNTDFLNFAFRGMEFTEQETKAVEWLMFREHLEGFSELFTKFLMFFSIGITMKGPGIMYTPERFTSEERRLIKNELQEVIKGILGHFITEGV